MDENLNDIVARELAVKRFYDQGFTDGKMGIKPTAQDKSYLSGYAAGITAVRTNTVNAPTVDRADTRLDRINEQ